MPGGRPRISDDEKKLRGTYRPSRGDGQPSDSKALIIDPGEPFFPLGSSGMQLYKDICTTLINYGRLVESDLMYVSMLCKEFETYIDVMDCNSVEMNPESGMTSPSGAFKVRSKALESIIKLTNQLGVWPTVRGRLRTTSGGSSQDNPKKPKDPLAEFF